MPFEASPCHELLANKGVDFGTTQDFLGHRDPKLRIHMAESGALTGGPEEA